jgi:hypothetical protein
MKKVPASIINWKFKLLLLSFIKDWYVTRNLPNDYKKHQFDRIDKLHVLMKDQLEEELHEYEVATPELNEEQN